MILNLKIDGVSVLQADMKKDRSSVEGIDPRTFDPLPPIGLDSATLTADLNEDQAERLMAALQDRAKKQSA